MKNLLKYAYKVITWGGVTLFHLQGDF